MSSQQTQFNKLEYTDLAQQDINDLKHKKHRKNIKITTYIQLPSQYPSHNSVQPFPNTFYIHKHGIGCYMV